jgi:FkbM family methyltransferase
MSAGIDNPKTINSLRAERLAGVITREEYWGEVRDKLRVLTEIVQIAQREDLTFEINAAGAQVVIPLENTENTIRMMLDIEDIRSVPFTVIAEGPYEQFQAQILFAFGQSAHGFLDIGANMGFYSLALATLNPALSVHSFEPQPRIYSSFAKNISLNRLESQVKIYNYGLGSRDDDLNMYIPRFTGSGGGSFANLHKEEGHAEEFLVRVRTLDTFVHFKSNTDLIKVDVEGFEFEVLSGGLELIESTKPTIVIELLRKWMKPFGKQPQDVINLLKPLGYEVLSIGPNHLTPITIIDESTLETNFIFVHKNNNKHLDLLRKNFSIE